MIPFRSCFGTGVHDRVAVVGDSCLTVNSPGLPEGAKSQDNNIINFIIIQNALSENNC